MLVPDMNEYPTCTLIEIAGLGCALFRIILPSLRVKAITGMVTELRAFRSPEKKPFFSPWYISTAIPPLFWHHSAIVE
jgi:hypothetical protein